MCLFGTGVAGDGVVLEASVVVVAVEDPEGSVAATMELATDQALVFGKGAQVEHRDSREGHLEEPGVLALGVGRSSLGGGPRNSRDSLLEAGQGHGPDTFFTVGAVGTLRAGRDRVGQATLLVPGAVHVGVGHGVVLADGTLGASQGFRVGLDFQHGLERGFELAQESRHDRDSCGTG